MYDTILIPYDGSEEGEKGADHGVDLAAALGASVHSLYVVDLPDSPRGPFIRGDEDQLREDYREYGEECNEEISEKAAGKGVDCTTAIRSGPPGQEIVEYAEEEELDAIVMGTGYRGKLAGLLGSTAEKVLRSTDTPVTTVRHRDNS